MRADACTRVKVFLIKVNKRQCLRRSRNCCIFVTPSQKLSLRGQVVQNPGVGDLIESLPAVNISMSKSGG